MRRAPLVLTGAATFLVIAVWLVPTTGAQSSSVPPATTYLTTWPVLISPNDIAANLEDGTLAVVDAGNSAIELLRPGGSHFEFLDGFRDPRCAAYLPGGILLVGEAESGTVKGYSEDGKVALTLGSSHGEFLSPNDIAVHPASGRIFVVDSAAHTVKAYRQADGAFEFQFGSFGTAPGEFQWPISVAVNANLNEVYVGDSRNRRIGVFDSGTGDFKRSLGSAGKGDGNISFVGGLHVDGHDRLFVVESLGGFVQVFTPDGLFLGKIGAHGNEGGHLRTPKAVVIDRYNRLAVTSFLDRRIEVWGLDSFQNPVDTTLEATADAIPSRIHPLLPEFQVFVQVAGLEPSDIDPDSLRLNGTVMAQIGARSVGPHLSARFSTSAALATLPAEASGSVAFTLSGATNAGERFEATVAVVIVPPPVSPPPEEEGEP